MAEKDEAILFLRNRIISLMKEQEKLGDQIKDLKVALEHLESSDNNLFLNSLIPASQEIPTSAKADDFRINRFKGRKLTEVVLELLSYNSETGTLSIDFLVKEIYIAKSEKHRKSCRATITSVIHKLKSRGEIEQVAPGVYKLADSSQRRLYAL